jgi:predicted O-methyltransferase YrrM
VAASEEVWEAVDDYLGATLIGADPALEAALRASEEGGLPAIQVTPLQGRLLNFLASLVGARRILEVGTLGGYSSIWLARALGPDGRLITLEIEPKHAEVARANLARAGLADRVEVRVGPALELLPGVAQEAPFDLAFIDADKPSNPDYFQWALKLVRPGGLIVVDNVVRQGAVVEADSTDPAVVGVRRVLEMMASEPRVQSTALQTVGAKGYDGFSVSLVRAGG